MRKLLFSAAVAALTFAGTALARAAPPKAIPTPAPTAALTDESLTKMLQDMGYEPNEERLDNGVVLNHLTFSQDDWDFHLTVQLSPNKEFLWVCADLKQVPEGGAPADVLLKLLAHNNDIGPAQVYYNAKNRWMGVGVPLLNRGGITTAVLRNHINLLLGDIKNTMPLCNFEEAPPALGPAGK